MVTPLTHDERVALFGKIPFKAQPTDANPERVIVPISWSLSNMGEVMIPQLATLGVRHSVTFHYKVKKQAAALWAEWERLGLLSNVNAWNGSWVSRFKRQNGSVEDRKARSRLLGEADLSNHAWGTAFDINAATYPLGTPRAKVSVGYLELVPVAEAFGFAWGGNFHSRPDPMHFEAYKVL